jgi:hypothetical protein
MKLKTGYSDLTPAEGVDLGNQVVTNMTGKSIWAGLALLLTQLPLDIAAVTAAMAASGPGAAAQLAAADDALSITLGNIADAANKTPNVTDADLASTGLPQVKQRVQLTEPPPAPQNLRLRHGQMPGTVDGIVDPIPGGNIRSYEGQWSLDADAGPWSDTFTFPNSRALRFTNLTRGKDTWFRIRGRNTVGAGPWSDPATIMVT